MKLWRSFSWTDVPLRAKSFVVLGIPVLSMLIIGISALVVQAANDDSERLIRHTHELRTTTERLYAALLSADTGLRGYLLTHDDAFLAPYRAAETELPALRERLNALVRDPAVRAQLPELNILIDRRTAQRRQVLSASGASDITERLRTGRETMSALRAVIDSMTGAQDRLLAARTAAHDRSRRIHRSILVGGLALGALGGVVATLLLTTGVVRRAQQLEGAAGALAAGEPLETPVREARDELGRVDAAMRRASRLLLERESALRGLNRELEAFSYSVSHDLRAPLRSIDGFSQALLEDYDDKLDATGRQYLMRSRAAAQRMAQLIDDILMLSRVTRAGLRPSAVDLSAVAQEIAAGLREQEPDRTAEWRIQPDLRVIGDPQLLRIALDNLLGNAWKFTGRRDTAVIEFGRADTNGTFVVRDNGAGFDMTYADKLFGAFQRLHASAEFPGTGIGLATVQRIISKHGGRIWAEGAADRGAAFYFTLGEGAT